MEKAAIPERCFLYFQDTLQVIEEYICKSTASPQSEISSCSDAVVFRNLIK